ncbi:MAG: TIGR03016 family PEP-CTERM system-associated outer membrane protein [Emcibacter sp.]|nr:TIGR03016 family PEP-CTERM system-associated outer membrane protein [Emcibacter sp.]
MQYYKKQIFLLLSTVAASGFIVNANAANWRVTPSIAVTETYTDNVDLDSSSNQGDFVTQITPQIGIRGNGSRMNLLFSYAPNYFFYPGDDDDKHELRHSLQSSLNSELISEKFFIDASANITQRFLDRRRAISSEIVSRTDNRRTVQSYQFSPYLVHTFDAWASAQLRYTLGHVRQAADAEQTTVDTFFGNTLSHQASLSVTSGRRFSKLNWTFLTQYQTENRENSNNYSTTTVRTDLSYQLTNIFTLLGSVGYQKRNAVGSFANFNGLTWDAGFRLVPGPRTSLSFRYGNQLRGNTFSLDAQYKITSKNVINLSYTDTIQTFQSFAFDDISSVNLDPALNSEFISGDLTRRKKWTLKLSGTRGRTTYNASSFYSEYKSDNLALDEERYGGALSINRNLNSRLSIGSGLSYNLSKFASDNINDKFWSASVNMSYQLSKSLTGTLGYVHSDRDQERFGSLNGGSNYISLSIRATL